MSLTGPDGLLKQLTKSVIEAALGEQMTDHLGYEKHDAAGVGSGNVRRSVSTAIQNFAPSPEPAVPAHRPTMFGRPRHQVGRPDPP